MEASGPATLQSTASSRTAPLFRSQFPPNRTPFQPLFETILEGGRETWIYVIYWEYSSATSLLGWGDGYYNGDYNGKACKATSSTEQAQRKSVIRLLNLLVSSRSATPGDYDEDVTDLKWFFLLSMAHTFLHGSGMSGQAFFNGALVWVTGPDRLSESACQRARQLREFGLQTMVCIPCPNGVVELASTEVVLPYSDLMSKVRDFIDFNYPVRDLTSHQIIPPREDKRLHEREYTEMQNHEDENLSKKFRGKEKISDSKCSLFMLSESSDGASRSTRSHSYHYSGPS
ncbi:transcription factor MYC2 [Vigna unguiculata]|uniref:Transcription factor n=1 Tax=Vigna unguiculata TaxID=3917 RepID=A0A4D6MHC6_VIGUN|nr:transcription factor MYC2 [Vigna unguiculata]